MKFKSMYTGEPYVPAATQSADGDSAPRHAVASRVSIRPFTAAAIPEAVAP